MKSKIYHVRKGSFTTPEGKVIEYCNFEVLTGIVDTENEYGYSFEKIKTNVANYNKLLAYAKSGQDLVLEFDYEKNYDGSYKKICKKINNETLV